MTNVAEAADLAQELPQLADVSVNAVPSSKVLVYTGEDTTALVAKLDKAKERIAELESAETLKVRRHNEILEEVKTRHAKMVGVWRETRVEIADSLITDIEVTKAYSVKMSLEKNLILAQFAELVRALQVLVSANMERKVTSTESMQRLECYSRGVALLTNRLFREDHETDARGTTANRSCEIQSSEVADNGQIG